LTISELRVYFAGMYFKVSMRTNPETKIYSGYYRLVESYRTNDDRVYHRTILNAGYLDELSTDQLNLIQKILTAKVKITINLYSSCPAQMIQRYSTM